jgi:hypothetical protein
MSDGHRSSIDGREFVPGELFRTVTGNPLEKSRGLFVTMMARKNDMISEVPVMGVVRVASEISLHDIQSPS